MLFSGVLVVWLAAGRVSVFAAGVTVDEGRYQLILDRNPFSLKDPPPAPVAPLPSNPPPAEVNVKISGISVTPQGKFVYLVVPPAPPKETNTFYWKILEGEAQGEIEVLSIDYDEGKVTIRNAGQQAVLSLDSDAPDAVGPAVAPAASAAAARAAGARPAVPVPARGVSRPTAVRSTSSSPTGATRVVRPGVSLPGGVRPTVGGSGGVPVGVGANSRSVSYSRAVPARPVRTTPGGSTEPVDPAMQWLILKANEERARAEGIQMPPTPPMPGLTE